MIHLDLFSGIGGFALAADTVFGDVEHIFCDNDKFCTKVLTKHWPEAYIYDDIKSITPDSYIQRYIYGQSKERPYQALRKPEPSIRPPSIQLLTGGFPCQPFSQAGLRRGTADERHLWPEMLRVIRLTQPEWVIAENVRGILTWNGGMVFEQVCADLEDAGYEVQPIIIPAVAVNAPHRRDRVWFIGHSEYYGQHGSKDSKGDTEGTDNNSPRSYELCKSEGADSLRPITTYPRGEYGEAGRSHEPQPEPAEWPSQTEEYQRPGWSRNWSEVAAELCSVDDGLPVELDGLKLSKPQHRKEQLKAYGNAIVPQVAMQIMQSIKESSRELELV